MGRIRFVRTELRYGCHWAVKVEVPEKNAPVVIAGRNGAGKTTLVEGLVRTLFGFSRRSPVERERLTFRMPWGREGCHGTVCLVDNQDTSWCIARDFDSDTVEVRRQGTEEPVYRGDGNPSATNQEALDYRRHLRKIFGISELEHYESTAFIAQGELIETELRGELLQVATGGYGNVDQALDRLKKEHHALTVQALSEDEGTRRKARQLEAIEAELQRLRERLTESEAAAARRTPIQAQLDECIARRREIESEIVALERALGPLHQREAIEARIANARTRLRTISKLRQRVEAATGELQLAAQEERLHPGDEYPENFLERTGRVETLWAQEATQRANLAAIEDKQQRVRITSAWLAPLTAGPLLLAAIAVYALSGERPLSMILAALGALVWAWLALGRVKRRRLVENVLGDRNRVQEELARLQSALRQQLEQLPDSLSLTPATIEKEKQLFGSKRAITERVVQARRKVQDLLGEAHETLESDRHDQAHPGEIQSGAQELDFLIARAGSLGEGLDDQLHRCQLDMAKEELRLEDLATIEIPSGVETSPQSAHSALDQRRTRRHEIEEAGRQLERRLLDEGSGHESIVALRDQLDVLEGERAEVVRHVRSYVNAHALLRSAYEEFRAGDQRRLVDSISVALKTLTSGVIGPLDVADSLTDAQVRLRGRPVDLASPPLSYGEFHAALLGVRLGASDFLARADVQPPLILDEPFAFLDPERAEHLWQLLCRIATERQVIVATQEALMLGALGVKPDIDLGTHSS